MIKYEDSLLSVQFQRFVEQAVAFLDLQDWEIIIRVVEIVSGDPTKDADCHAEEPYCIALIQLKRDASEDDMAENIVHELLHIVHAPMSTAASYVQDLVPFKHQPLAARILNDAAERVVTPLAKTLLRSLREPGT